MREPGQEAPTVAMPGNTYRRLKTQYAHWYSASPSTLFRVYNWSLTGSSAWLEINGALQCVPRFCLVDSAEFDLERARAFQGIGYELVRRALYPGTER